MWIIDKKEHMLELENQRTLVGIFVDRNYNRDRINWVLEAKEGFDAHSEGAWHLLIPAKSGYGVDTYIEAGEYNTMLAGMIINRAEIDYASLPAIVFRAYREDFYFVKLGGKDRDAFFQEIGMITDLAQKCFKEGPSDPAEYRDYVNAEMIRDMRKRKVLSAAATAVPSISKLIGAAVGLKDLF